MDTGHPYEGLSGIFLCSIFHGFWKYRMRRLPADEYVESAETYQALLGRRMRKKYGHGIIKLLRCGPRIRIFNNGR